MSDKKNSTQFKAGDKIKMVWPGDSTGPNRIGSEGIPTFFAAVLNGKEGAVKYGQVYLVSGSNKVDLIDNHARPLPLIDKEFVNHPRFNGLFTGVKSPNKTDTKED